jgi:acetyl/propionyl-CoA carboxylase alpha subunit
VPPEYDNLLAKIMVQAGDRLAAIRRLERALGETEIAGLQTTLPFHRFVAGHPAFRAAELSTGWVERWWDGPAEFRRAARLAQEAAALDALESGLVTAAIARGAEAPAPSPSAAPGSRWASSGRQAATDRWPA